VDKAWFDNASKMIEGSVIKEWVSKDGRSSNNTKWFNVIVKRNNT